MMTAEWRQLYPDPTSGHSSNSRRTDSSGFSSSQEDKTPDMGPGNGFTYLSARYTYAYPMSSVVADATQHTAGEPRSQMPSCAKQTMISELASVSEMQLRREPALLRLSLRGEVLPALPWLLPSGSVIMLLQCQFITRDVWPYVSNFEADKCRCTRLCFSKQCSQAMRPCAFISKAHIKSCGQGYAHYCTHVIGHVIRMCFICLLTSANCLAHTCTMQLPH